MYITIIVKRSFVISFWLVSIFSVMFFIGLFGGMLSEIMPQYTSGRIDEIFKIIFFIPLILISLIGSYLKIPHEASYLPVLHIPNAWFDLIIVLIIYYILIFLFSFFISFVVQIFKFIFNKNKS